MDSNAKRFFAAAGLLPWVAGAAAQAQSFPQDAGEEHSGTWTLHHENVMGTSLEVRVRATDEAGAAHAEAAALAVFDRETAVLSAWSTQSEFSRWQRTRFQAVPVSAELMTTLAAFDAWRVRTDGALDASVEAATQLWKRATAEGRVPTDAEIAETREAMAQEHWKLDAAGGTATRLSDVPLALATFVKSRVTQKAADAALAAGASGVMLNVGGDVVVRGAMAQVVAVTNPARASENDAALDYVVVRDRAVATSGSYRRGFEMAGVAAQGPASPHLIPDLVSHLIDARTAQPVSHVTSSTVVARDAETAGALATAFSVMPLDASRQLAAKVRGVEYMIVTAGGEVVRSAGWAKYQPFGAPATLERTAYLPPAKPAVGMWNPAFELVVDLNLPRMEDARYRRPYVAVWIEDADHFPVRTLSLWTQNPRWLPELKQWYREDQIRNLSEGTDVSRTVGSATRPPGKYTLRWDGKDNEGKPVKAGEYTVVIEASREHGGYQLDHKAISFTGVPAQVTVAPGQELGAVTLDYRKR